MTNLDAGNEGRKKTENGFQQYLPFGHSDYNETGGKKRTPKIEKILKHITKHHRLLILTMAMGRSY